MSAQTTVAPTIQAYPRGTRLHFADRAEDTDLVFEYLRPVHACHIIRGVASGRKQTITQRELERLTAQQEDFMDALIRAHGPDSRIVQTWLDLGEVGGYLGDG